MGFVKSTRRYKLKLLPVADLTADEQINHRLHFYLNFVEFWFVGTRLVVVNFESQG